MAQLPLAVMVALDNIQTLLELLFNEGVAAAVAHLVVALLAQVAQLAVVMGLLEQPPQTHLIPVHH
jgi:hypothetical protein